MDNNGPKLSPKSPERPLEESKSSFFGNIVQNFMTLLSPQAAVERHSEREREVQMRDEIERMDSESNMRQSHQTRKLAFPALATSSSEQL